MGRLLGIGQRPDDDPDLRIRKRTAVAVVYALMVAGLFYAALAIATGQPVVLAFSLGQILAQLREGVEVKGKGPMTTYLLDPAQLGINGPAPA